MLRETQQMMNRDEIKAVYELGPDAVIELVERLFAVIQEQQHQIASLTERVKELEDRLATDSHNSSKPPSSDRPKQTRSLRQPSGKKPGAQPGHKGHRLQPVATPDHVVLHPVEQCQHCQHGLGHVPASGYEARQVFELPPLKLAVTEHRVELKLCPGCGQNSRGQFPASVTQAVQYGSQLKGLVAYLMNYQLLPYRRTRELLADLLGQPLAEGTLQAVLTEASQALAATETRIKTALQSVPVAHFDETGLYVGGHRHWVHVVATPHLTHYAWDRNRGPAALEQIAILPSFGGRAVHDGYHSYQRYQCAHALCNAHHLRELTFLEERCDATWATQMKALLREIKQAVEQTKAAGHTALPPACQHAFEHRYQAILTQGFDQEATRPALPRGKRGRPKQSKAKNLLDRLSRQRHETLAFMTDFQVPFDNNLAERDLRMLKVQQKIAGCFRTPAGATAFCRIRSYVSTVRKQGHNVLTALKQVFAGDPIPVLTG